MKGKPGERVPADQLVNVPRLLADYYTLRPDLTAAEQKVAFGTSGHRGTSASASFTESHVLAISQAVAEYRASQDCAGPLILGKDTHALSEAAQRSAVEVFAANGAAVWIQADDGFTPTPAVSRAILRYNHSRPAGLADGVILTPSHNPPQDGGFKYNPPNGGPADASATSWIQDRANQLLRNNLRAVKRLSYARAKASGAVIEKDFVQPYVKELGSVVDMKAVQSSGIKIGVDPMGGAGLAYWRPIQERYKLNLEVANARIDPAFSFMTLDGDGKVRMDCSSPFAMSSLIWLKDRFDVAFGNDPDGDRHGIVTKSGLMNPNHFLAASVRYLFQHRPNWRTEAAVGKTLVSSSIIDRVAASLGRKLVEVPVGFKWFVPGLLDGSCGFGGEESAGASFLRRDGSAWTTDKDGIILGLLAAEILAVTGQDPAALYRDLEAEFGYSCYRRIDAPANLEQRNRLKTLSASQVQAKELAGEPILAKLTRAPGNNAPIGGLKVSTKNAWFAARPSGTENIYKIYAESFRGPEHLQAVQQEAQTLVNTALGNP